MISVPISQPDRFELGQLQISDTIYVGNSTSVTLNFVNKGKTPFPTWKLPFPARTWALT